MRENGGWWVSMTWWHDAEWRFGFAVMWWNIKATKQDPLILLELLLAPLHINMQTMPHRFPVEVIVFTTKLLPPVIWLSSKEMWQSPSASGTNGSLKWRIKMFSQIGPLPLWTGAQTPLFLPVGHLCWSADSWHWYFLLLCFGAIEGKLSLEHVNRD